MIPTGDRPTLHALLIGIDAYPSYDGEASTVPRLGGCVQDVERMEELLRGCGVPKERIETLTAADDAPERPPTRRAIVDAWLALAERTRPGEQALVHFSGHGARLATAFGAAKRGASYDEAIVPWDVAPGSPLLRDLEICFLLKKLVEKEVFVTLVFDCCHSGGTAVRGDDEETAEGPARVRLAAALDDDRHPLGDLASREDLLAAWEWWRRPLPDETRDWLASWQLRARSLTPIPRGYVLFAACRYDQEAREIDWQEGRRNGLLTHSLVTALAAATGETTYRQVFERLAAAYRPWDPVQQPEIEGEVDRALFGGSWQPMKHRLRVLHREGDRLLLDGGQAHGLRRRAAVRIVQGERMDGARQARLVEVGAVESWARLAAGDGPEDLTSAWAVVDDPGDPTEVLAVRFDLAAASDGEREALEAVAAAAADASRGFLRVAGHGEPADLRVSVADGRFRLHDGDGEPLSMRPQLAAAAGEAARLAERMVHYARYRNVERLHNAWPYSPLAGRLDLRLDGLPAGWQPGDPMAVEPLARVDGVYRVRAGAWVCLTVRNRSRSDLFVSLLDLRPDWSVKQLLPHAHGGRGHLLEGDPAEPPLLVELMKPSLPAGVEAGRDVLKVFATTRPTRFDWLTLPPLDRPIERGAFRGPAGDAPSPLEEMRWRWGCEPHRDFQAAAAAGGGDWTTVQVETWMTAG